MNVFVCVGVNGCECVCICVFVCMCVCVCVCVCISVCTGPVCTARTLVTPDKKTLAGIEASNNESALHNSTLHTLHA
jgi:hypothetical protein